MTSTPRRRILLSLPPAEDEHDAQAFNEALAAVDGVVVTEPGVDLQAREVIITVAQDTDISVLSAYSCKELDTMQESINAVNEAPTSSSGVSAKDAIEMAPDSASGSESLSAGHTAEGNEEVDGPSDYETHGVIENSTVTLGVEVPLTNASCNVTDKPCTFVTPRATSNFIPEFESELSKLKHLKPLPNDIFRLVTQSHLFFYGFLLCSMVYGQLV